MLRKTTASLLRTTAVIRGITEATIQAHQIVQAKMVLRKAQMEKELNSTKINGEEDSEKRTQLDEFISEMKKNAQSINDLQVQVNRYTAMVRSITDKVQETVPPKATCQMCTKLARIALEKQRYNGMKTIKIMKGMDKVCKGSKYPGTCYKTLIELGSRMFEKGTTPNSACASINKC